MDCYTLEYNSPCNSKNNDNDNKNNNKNSNNTTIKNPTTTAPVTATIISISVPISYGFHELGIFSVFDMWNVENDELSNVTKHIRIFPYLTFILTHFNKF